MYPDELMRVANEQTSLDVSRFDYCGVEIRFLTYDRRGEQETVVSAAVRHSISRSRSKAPLGSELSSCDNQVEELSAYQPPKELDPYIIKAKVQLNHPRLLLIVHKVRCYIFTYLITLCLKKFMDNKRNDRVVKVYTIRDSHTSAIFIMFLVDLAV